MDASVTVKPHGHHKTVENRVAKDKSMSCAAVTQGKAKVSSHSYSQLRPVRGDGMTRLASPTHKKHQDKDNETDNRGWENSNTTDDGGWSMGAPGRGSGWNNTGKAEGSAVSSGWQVAVKGGATTLNCAQSPLPRVGDSNNNQTKEWPIPSRNSGKNNSSTSAWMKSSDENINNSISDGNWEVPQNVEASGSKHMDSEMTFELDALNLEPPGKEDTFYNDMNWTSEELEPKHNPAGSIASPRHDKLCFSRSPKVPQVSDIIATVDSRGVAETGYIPFGNPLKQVHSSDRRWTSKDSVSSTGSCATNSLQSPQRNNMGSRMFQGKLSNPHSKLSTSARGDKNSINYNHNANKPKNISLYTSDSADKEPTGWGDLPSPNADLVDNGTSDWARPTARERQRMLIKSQLDGINGWDNGPPTHWDDKFDTSKTAGWAELARQTGQQSSEDNDGWCTVNGRPSKSETFHHQVQTLVEMGFKKEDCERVLKANSFNLEHALGDLLALTCTEEMSITTANTELTKLQSVATTAATSASLLAKHAMTAQMSAISSSSAILTGTTSTTTSGNVWTSKAANPITMPPLSTSLSVSQALSSAAQALPLQQNQLNPQMLQPPVLPAKLLSDISATSSSVGQQKQQLLSHLKLVNYHLAFLTKMQQTLFQKLSLFNDTSALMTGLPPPLVQQQKQELLLQLQQVNTMIVIYSQQSVLLKQLSSSGNASGSNGSKNSPKVSKAGAAANSDSSNSEKESSDPVDQKSDQEVEDKDKDTENVSADENEPNSNQPKEILQPPDQISIDDPQKSITNKVGEETSEAQEEEGIEEISDVTLSDVVASKEESTQASNSEMLLPSSITSVTTETPQLSTSTTLSSVRTYDDDNFPPEFQPGKLWVPRSQATESSQLVPASKPNGLQPMNSATKNLSNAAVNSMKPVQAAQMKSNKFAPHFVVPQNSTAKVGIPSGITPMTQTLVRPGMPPAMGNKFTPSTRQIQNSINNLMFAQLGNNAAAAAAARKGTFPAPTIPGGFPRPGKKNMPIPQFPPPFMNGNNYGSFPNLQQPAMPPPPPPPQMGTTFPMKNQQPYSPHSGMKKSSSFPGKPPGIVPPVMAPQQPSMYNYQPAGANKTTRAMLSSNGNFHGTGGLVANGNGMRQQVGVWDAGKFGGVGFQAQQPQMMRPPPAGLSGAVDQQLTMPLSLGESLWSDNPNSPVSVTSPDPTFAEWQAGKKAHIFKIPNNSPSSWLVLRNLPPQIDHATLRDLCSGYGAVQTFYMSESMSNGLVRYSSTAEATEAKMKLERANFNGVGLIVDFASDSDIGEIIDSISPRQGSPPPLSFTATAASDECWEDTYKPQAADSKWFSSTAPMNIAPNSDVPSSAAWKGGDLFAPWATQQNDSADTNSTDNTNHLATSPSMATFLPNGLL